MPEASNFNAPLCLLLDRGRHMQQHGACLNEEPKIDLIVACQPNHISLHDTFKVFKHQQIAVRLFEIRSRPPGAGQDMAFLFGRSRQRPSDLARSTKEWLQKLAKEDTQNAKVRWFRWNIQLDPG